MPTPTTLESLQAQVLSLSKADRSRLLERLVASLDVDVEAEEAWEQLAEAREAKLQSGRSWPCRLRMPWQDSGSDSPDESHPHPGAEQDVAEAAAFYESEASPALAGRFVAEFERIIKLLLSNSGLGTPRSNGITCRLRLARR